MSYVQKPHLADDEIVSINESSSYYNKNSNNIDKKYEMVHENKSNKSKTEFGFSDISTPNKKLPVKNQYERMDPSRDAGKSFGLNGTGVMSKSSRNS